jgi:hypothetical protein
MHSEKNKELHRCKVMLIQDMVHRLRSCNEMTL